MAWKGKRENWKFKQLWKSSDESNKNTSSACNRRSRKASQRSRWCGANGGNRVNRGIQHRIQKWWISLTFWLLLSLPLGFSLVCGFSLCSLFRNQALYEEAEDQPQDLLRQQTRPPIPPRVVYGCTSFTLASFALADKVIARPSHFCAALSYLAADLLLAKRWLHLIQSWSIEQCASFISNWH